MAEPSDEDRQRARDLYWNLPNAFIDECVEMIAQALADARAKQLREVAQALEDKARAHESDYPGAFAEGLDAAAAFVRGQAERG